MLENKSWGSNSFRRVNRIHEVTKPPEEIFFAGGCLWGVQEFVRHLPGVISTEAGRANGANDTTQENTTVMRNAFVPCLIPKWFPLPN